MIRYCERQERYLPIVERLFFNPEGTLFAASYDEDHKIYTVNRVGKKAGPSFKVTSLPSDMTAKDVVFLRVDEEMGYLRFRPRDGRFK